MAHCLFYGTEFVCSFNDISEPLKQTIFTILDCKYDSLDLSELILITYGISAEIERIGKTILALARELQEKIHSKHSQLNGDHQAGNHCKHEDPQTESSGNRFCLKDVCNQLNDYVTNRKPQFKEEPESEMDKKYAMSLDKSGIYSIEAKLVEEREKNDRLESKLEQLRIIQEDRLTKMEERVKQAEMTIEERLKLRKFERKREQQNLLQKNVQMFGKNTSRLELPKCNEKPRKEDCDQRLVVSPAKWLQTKKSEIQLHEEIKWTRITPVSVLGAKKRYQQSLTDGQRKIKHKDKSPA